MALSKKDSLRLEIDHLEIDLAQQYAINVVGTEGARSAADMQRYETILAEMIEDWEALTGRTYERQGR